jgi:hypothetical protein
MARVVVVNYLAARQAAAVRTMKSRSRHKCSEATFPSLGLPTHKEPVARRCRATGVSSRFRQDDR